MAIAFAWRTALGVAWAIGWRLFWDHHLWVLHWMGHSFIEAGRSRSPIVDLNTLSGTLSPVAVAHWVPQAMVWLPSVSSGTANVLISFGYLLGFFTFAFGWPPGRRLHGKKLP